ncbi:unnamed protein product [Mycena citricolor]|uniref:Uncharacterized protein n=1 Tax=Mycena citricolor TaxID=2018698 RepID=A0AAD2H4K9_9AGAR|nr:unnamed protein product [Mycena citricolor]
MNDAGTRDVGIETRGGKAEERGEPMAPRLAATGDDLSAISPARRVLLDILPRWWIADYPIHGNGEGRNRREGNKECYANLPVSETHVAFEGVESYAVTPARRVPPTITPVSSADAFVLEASPDEKTLFTRLTNPFMTERVQKIVELVEIGLDVSTTERETARALVKEYTDIFALAVSEVKAVPGRKYSPKIPKGHDFGTKTVNQRPMSPPQLAFLTKQVDELVAAGILRRIDAKDVR